MRLLTTDELFAVSGGSLHGQDDPLSYHPHSDPCAKIEKRGMRDQCYLETARSQNCPGGWTEKKEGGSAGGDGIQGSSTTVECKAAPNDDGNDNSDGDGNSNDNGNG